MDCGRGINLPFEICQLTDPYDFIHATIKRMNADVDQLVMKNGKLPRPLCYGRMVRQGIRAFATVYAKHEWCSIATKTWFPLFDDYLLAEVVQLDHQKRRGRIPQRCVRLEPKINLLFQHAMLPQTTRVMRVKVRRVGIELFGLEALNGVDAALETTHGLLRRYLSCWPNPHTSDGRYVDEEF